jgi:hypothetical protein
MCPDAANVTGSYTYDYGYGDYSEGLFPFGDYGVANKIQCLQFGAPYVTSGFSLLSLVTAEPFNVMTALFSPDVCNAATVILIIACSAGFLVSLLEKRNMHLGTPSRGLYWSLLTFLMVAEEQPRQKPARVVMILYLLANIVGLSVITSIISAKLTTTALSVTYIMTLKDVTGTLCVESNYQVLMDFVQRDPGKPVSIVAFPIDECIAMLQAGEVMAVVTDRTVLSWYTNYYQIPSTFIGPMLQSNPFAFVYANATNGLMGYVVRIASMRCVCAARAVCVLSIAWLSDALRACVHATRTRRSSRRRRRPRTGCRCTPRSFSSTSAPTPPARRPCSKPRWTRRRSSCRSP